MTDHYVWPVEPHTDITDTFASHVARGSVNPGVDFAVPVGTSVVAIANGTVTVVDDNPDGSGGKMVHVDHDDGTGADYLHLSGISVPVGTRVTPNRLLGYSGNTGASTGPHLHFTYRLNHNAWFGSAGNTDFLAVMAKQGDTASSGESTGDIIKNVTEEGNMRYIFNSRRGGALLGPLGVILLPDAEEAFTASTFFNGVDVTDRQFDVLKQVVTKYALNAKAVLKG